MYETVTELVVNKNLTTMRYILIHVHKYQETSSIKAVATKNLLSGTKTQHKQASPPTLMKMQSTQRRPNRSMQRQAMKYEGSSTAPPERIRNEVIPLCQSTAISIYTYLYYKVVSLLHLVQSPQTAFNHLVHCEPYP